MTRLPTACVVYHNPVCSKSRGALEILGERGVDVEVIEYLKAHPSRADLERIVDAIPDAPARSCARTSASGARPRCGDYQTKDEVVALLLEHPELMERPVVFRGDQAVIARPSERVLELLD